MDQHSQVDGSPIDVDPDSIRLAVLQIAGGDPGEAAALRSMMWHAYRNAGYPLGASEDGMYRWWQKELAQKNR